MSEALARVEPRELAPVSDPDAEVEWATRCAKALMRAIDSNPQLKVAINGRDYLKVEAWQTIGAMAKVDQVQTVWCREYTAPGASQPIGWEARVEVLDRDGHVRGSGEAMCVRSERTWATRDEFALRSMAQTRAMGKAYRMALAFIVSLAGFEPTPAEEMPVSEPAAGGAASVSHATAATGAAAPSTSGEYVYPFGKHKGKLLSQVPRDYLEWAVGSLEDKPDVKAALRAFLDGSAAPEQTVLEGEVVDSHGEEIPF